MGRPRVKKPLGKRITFRAADDMHQFLLAAAPKGARKKPNVGEFVRENLVRPFMETQKRQANR